MKILVVEDDAVGGQALKHLLASYHYAVDLAEDGETGLELIEVYDYDVILLDVLLPGMDGLSLCQLIRSSGVQTPILLLTGQGGASKQKAEALNAGADDYVSKPFDVEELIARIQALLRRGQVQNQPVLTWGKLAINPSTRQGTYGTRLLTLTPKQYAMLEMFLRNPNQVFSAQTILNRVWDSYETPGEEAVRVHIKELRRKLQEAGAPKNFIATVYRTGYRLNPMYSSEVATLEEDNLSIPQVAQLKAANEELRLALERLQTTEIELRQKNQVLAETQQQLAQDREQLANLNQTLELEVAERTASLAETTRKLQEQEQQWRALFEQALDAILITDNAGCYIDANPAACDLFGLSKSELLNTCVADFAGDDIDMQQFWQHFLQTGQMTGPFRVHRPDGTVRETEFAAVANFIPGRHLSILRARGG